MIPIGSPKALNIPQSGERKNFLPSFPSFPPSFNVVFIQHSFHAEPLSGFLHVLFHDISSQTSLGIRSTLPAQLCSAPAFHSLVPGHHLLSPLVSWLVLLSSSTLHPTSCQFSISCLAPLFLLPCLDISPEHQSLFISGLPASRLSF